MTRCGSAAPSWISSTRRDRGIAPSTGRRLLLQPPPCQRDFPLDPAAKARDASQRSSGHLVNGRFWPGAEARPATAGGRFRCKLPLKFWGPAVQADPYRSAAIIGSSHSPQLLKDDKPPFVMRKTYLRLERQGRSIWRSAAIPYLGSAPAQYLPSGRYRNGAIMLSTLNHPEAESEYPNAALCANTASSKRSNKLSHTQIRPTRR